MGDDTGRASPPDSAEDAAEGTWSDPAGVSRSVDVDAPVDDVLELVIDPDQRALWLDDADARTRTSTPPEIVPAAAPPGRTVSWTWWHPGEADPPSRVVITVVPADEGTTRVTVTETLLGASSVMRAGASPLAPALLWDRRLLGLELLFLVAVSSSRL